MIDITHKYTTLRTATAQAIVKVGSQATIDRIQSNTVPKGDVFEMSKAAGLLGVKKTPDLLPDCHPLPIESTRINYEISGLEIKVLVEVKTIYKTGVEVEAMHGASIVALNMYDMLKPIDKQIEILNIKLLDKKGGKSSMKQEVSGISAHVVVCSDTVAKGEKEDKGGKAIIEMLKERGVADISCEVIPDEKDEIQKVVNASSSSLLIFTGGTGVGPRDVTPDAIEPMLDTRLHGVEEAIRSYGQQRLPLAMLSRSLAGISKGKVILALPGSTGGAKDAINAVFPGLLHIFHVLGGGRHD